MWNLEVERLLSTHGICFRVWVACILQRRKISTTKNCDGTNFIYKSGFLFFVCVCGVHNQQVSSLVNQHIDSGAILHFSGVVCVWTGFFFYWGVRVEKLLNLKCSANPAWSTLQTLDISCMQSLTWSTGKENLLTVTFHPLMDKSIQQWPTVITEGGASISVDFKLVLAPGVLEGRRSTLFTPVMKETHFFWTKPSSGSASSSPYVKVQQNQTIHYSLG